MIRHAAVWIIFLLLASAMLVSDDVDSIEGRRDAADRCE